MCAFFCRVIVPTWKGSQQGLRAILSNQVMVSGKRSHCFYYTQEYADISPADISKTRRLASEQKVLQGGKYA